MRPYFCLQVLIFCALKFTNLIDLVFFFFGKLLKLKNNIRVLNEQDFFEICHEIENIEIWNLHENQLKFDIC